MGTYCCNNENEQYMEYRINEDDKEQTKRIAIKDLNRLCKSLCKIIVQTDDNIKNGIGFFITFEKEKTYNYLITDSNIVPKIIIDLKHPITITTEEANKHYIKLDSNKRNIKCLYYQWDLTAIEILDTDTVKKEVEFLSFDINKVDNYEQYLNKEVLILQNPGNGNNYNYNSTGKIININNFEFEHSFISDIHLAGSPIILISDLKVIGINRIKNKTDKNDFGTFIGALFNEDSEKNETTGNIMSIRYKINENKNENKNENENDDSVRIFTNEFVKLNSEKCKIILNGIEESLTSSIDKNQVETYDKIFEIQLKEIKAVTNLKGIFYFCHSIPDISRWNTSKVNNMSYMFNYCKKLKSLPDISKWDTSNVTDMRGMFLDCESLSSLPDISKWDTSKVTDMSNMFFGCKSLKTLPDISDWNTGEVKDMSNMFSGCESLTSLPDISKWDTDNVTEMFNMFGRCKNTLIIPDKFKK